MISCNFGYFYSGSAAVRQPRLSLKLKSVWVFVKKKELPCLDQALTSKRLISLKLAVGWLATAESCFYWIMIGWFQTYNVVIYRYSMWIRNGLNVSVHRTIPFPTCLFEGELTTSKYHIQVNIFWYGLHWIRTGS